MSKLILVTYYIHVIGKNFLLRSARVVVLEASRIVTFTLHHHHCNLGPSTTITTTQNYPVTAITTRYLPLPLSSTVVHCRHCWTPHHRHRSAPSTTSKSLPPPPPLNTLCYRHYLGNLHHCHRHQAHFTHQSLSTLHHHHCGHPPSLLLPNTFHHRCHWLVIWNPPPRLLPRSTSDYDALGPMIFLKFWLITMLSYGRMWKKFLFDPFFWKKLCSVQLVMESLSLRTKVVCWWKASQEEFPENLDWFSLIPRIRAWLLWCASHYSSVWCNFQKLVLHTEIVVDLKFENACITYLTCYVLFEVYINDH